MSRVNVWWPMYPADFAIDTQGLTPEQIGVYVILLNQYWRTEGNLSGDDAFFARIVQLSVRKWKNNRKSMERFFSVDLNGNWRHEKMDKELEKARQLSDSRRKSGKAGGKKTQAIAKANAQAIGSDESEQLLKQRLTPSPSPSLTTCMEPITTTGTSLAEAASKGVL